MVHLMALSMARHLGWAMESSKVDLMALSMETMMVLQMAPL